MADTSRRAGAGRSNTGEEPFGPSDVTPGLAGGHRARQKARHSRARTPSDAQVMGGLDELQRAAYEEGRRNGTRPGPEAPDSVHAAFDAGYAEHEEGRRRPRRATKTPPAAGRAPAASGGSPTVTVQDEGAEFILGVLAYCLLISYVRYGWPGVTGWLSAKFTNKVTITTTSPAQAAQTAATGAGLGFVAGGAAK